jgi:TrmH family RNA methyltransferase
VEEDEPEGAPYLPPAVGGRCGNDAPLILGCAGLQDPGNLGTILRSAEAFGASGVLATEGTVSSANPKVARASAGSVFRLPCIKLTTAQALEALAAHGIRLAVTSSHQGRPVHQIDLTLPTAIFIGSEGHGVPRVLLDAADEAILIPHNPAVESLNAAIAAAILLYEAQRQRSK